MKTMKGGGPLINWAALAPFIEHETRESIVEALRWIGPLSAPDLKGVLDDPEFQLAYVAYHLSTLVGEEFLAEVGERPTGASIEKIYFFAVPA
jgi:hypothetical protein